MAPALQEAEQMTYQLSRPRRRPSRLMVAVWAVATLIIATIGSAALGDMGVRVIEFQRALPVVLLGEALVYILALGGGQVPGPTLLVAFVGGFIFRGGIALLATELAPRGQAESLLAGAQYYYASCWPAVAMQIILVALLLRLSRRALARRRRPRRAIPQLARATEEGAASRREHLMAALMDSPDAPPVMATIAEEQQIGDLGGLEETTGQEAPSASVADRHLPFEAGASSEAAPQRPDEDLEEADESGAEVAEGDTGEETEALEPLRPAVEEPAHAVEQLADAVEPAAAPEQSAQAVPETTGTGAPPAAEPPEPQLAPDETLQEMIDTVVSRFESADSVQMRIWRTADQRTILAALPAGVAAAEIGPQADSLIRAHLHLCAQMGIALTGLQLGAADGGGYAVRALDEGGALLLLLTSTGDLATSRLEMVARAVFNTLHDLATKSHPPDGSVQPPSALALEEDVALSERISEVSMHLTPSAPMQWRAHRRGPDEIIAVAGALGAECSLLAEAIAAGADAAEALASALGLGELSWLAMSGPSASLAVCRCDLDGNPALLACVSSPTQGVGQALWNLRRLAELVSEPAH